MKKFNLKKCKSSNKGITLIALIITIIVLLILAGVTIAQLTGSDSAPNKANEAKQKNDIGTARDDVSLTATNALTEAYETAYVANGVEAKNASTTVGTLVRTKLNQKYGTDGNFKTGLATITATATGNIEISTTDFVIEGEIAAQGGNLTWGEIEPNVPRIVGVPTHLEIGTDELPYTINALLKGTTGSITWSNGGSTVVNVSNGQLSLATSITGSSVTANITASATGCETKTCAVTITKVVVPQVGDIVNYSPSGQYNWKAKYASSDLSDADTNGDGIGDKDILLASGTTYSNLTDAEKAKYDSTSNMSVTQWKILNYDASTKTVEMVPTASVGSLRLQGAQGYNNAVKMLNDACSNLYSTASKNITARSIKEEDFVKAGKHENQTDTDSNNAWTRFRTAYSNGVYDSTKSSAYSNSYSWYPNIHANEYGNGLGNSVTLGLSEQTGSLIERTINSAENTKFKPEGTAGIQPKHTYYNTTAYNTTKGLLDNAKYGVLLPNTSNTSYWVASRCVNLEDYRCGFYVRTVDSGYLNVDGMFYSYDSPSNGSRALFPVVSLSSNLLDLKSTSGNVQTFDIK